MMKKTANLTVLMLLLSACTSLQNSQSDLAIIKPPADNPALTHNPVYRLLVAEMAINRGQTDLATAYYLALAKSQPNPALAERAVQVAIYSKNLAAATEAAQRWIALDPEQANAYQAIILIYTRQNQVENAFHYLQKLIANSEHDDKQLFPNLLSLFLEEDNIETIATLIQKVAEHYPQRAYALYLNAIINAQRGKLEEALFYIDQALNHGEIEAAHNVRARLLMALKKYEKARVEFEHLYRQSPDNHELLYTLGLLAIKSQRLHEAEKHFLKLLHLGIRKDETHYYLARIYMAKAERLSSTAHHQAAIQVYNTALEIIPNNHELLYARALTANDIGRIDILEADLKTILKTEPNNAHALNALGFTLADQTNRYKEAYELIKRALDIMPEDAAIIDSFGWVHFRLKHYSKAIRLLRLALARHENNEIAAHLGEVLWVSGAKDEAWIVWQKALQKSPDDALIQQVIQRLTQ